MSVSIILENADNATINAIKSVIKLKPQVKFKIKREKSPSDELLAAIAELKDMKKNPQRYKAYKSAKDMIKACLDE